MRAAEQCPKCHSTVIWVIDKVEQPDPTTGQQTIPFVVTSWKDLLSERVDAGTFEARVCDQCGYTEFYARNFQEKLAALSQHGWSGVRLIARNVPRGPFR